jgi:hypothetical protein
MTTLMRNGRDRRSENPSGPKRYSSAGDCPGPISGSHQGQQPLRLHRDRGNPPSENRPYTWLHPNASQKVKFALAPRAPSIHGPSRPILRRNRMSAFRGRIQPVNATPLAEALRPWRWSNSSIESQYLRHRSRSSRSRTTSATHWPLFQRSQGSVFSFGVNHARACPSICIPFQRARLGWKGVASTG